MKQEVFDGIACGKLPLLAASLTSQQVPMGDIHLDGSDSASNLVGPSPAPVRAQWIGLLAQISHIAEQCTHLDMVRQLKASGVKRARTTVIHLAREYVEASGRAASMGYSPSAQEVLRVTQTMRPHGQLVDEYRKLADAYRELSTALAPKDRDFISHWINHRLSVHDSQAHSPAVCMSDPMLRKEHR
ncbi:hypothetical protein [Pseudomonas aeruginosa]|uniref:hypothetical protein n=1 Tax=Pseudomonas aeruginosa TaxID=287 RepID=UPI0031B7149D